MATSHDTTPRKPTLTTGQVATICMVAPRTVAKWIDKGLLAGWKIAVPAGSSSKGDRRVDIGALEDFLRFHGMGEAIERLEDFRSGLVVEKHITKLGPPVTPKRAADPRPGTKEDDSGYVYFIQLSQGSPIKIGFSYEPVKRVRGLQGMSPTKIRCLGVMLGGRLLEHQLHRKFADDRVSHEWFNPSPALLRYITENAASLDILSEESAPSLRVASAGA